MRHFKKIMFIDFYFKIKYQIYPLKLQKTLNWKQKPFFFIMQSIHHLTLKMEINSF